MWVGSWKPECFLSLGVFLFVGGAVWVNVSLLEISALHEENSGRFGG